MPHLEVFYQQINIEKKLVLFNTKNIVSNGQLLDWCTVTKMVPVVGTFFSKWVPIRSLVSRSLFGNVNLVFMYQAKEDVNFIASLPFLSNLFKYYVIEGGNIEDIFYQVDLESFSRREIIICVSNPATNVSVRSTLCQTKVSGQNIQFSALK